MIDTLRSCGAAFLLTALMANGAAAQTLVYCSNASPEGFDPALHTEPATFVASSRQIYDRLVSFVPGTTMIEPALAESWEVSEDGLEITFNLRRGVVFHSNDVFSPTREFNADDVVFSFERQRLADHPYHTVSGGSWDYFRAMSMPELIASVEKIDDLTVRFVLTQPHAPMLANLGMDFASILSAEYADAMAAAGTPEMLDVAPIGTGAFAFAGYETDISIRYVANPDHWGGAATVEGLTFSITPSASARVEKLRSGECHAMSHPPRADIQSLQDDPDITLITQTGLDVGYLAYNTRVPPFDNANVRRALNMAIDKQAIIDIVFQGHGTAAKNPIPPSVWAHSEDTVDDTYDPAAARGMLADEGITNLEMKLWAMPVMRPYNPNSRRMAELVQSDLAAIGVTVEILSYQWTEYLARSRAPDRDGAVLLGWMGNNGDPDNFLGVLLGCDGVGRANRAQWCHPPFEELITRARTVSDPAARASLYREAQAIFKTQAPWATIAHSFVAAATRAEVEGFRIDAFGVPVFNAVSLPD